MGAPMFDLPQSISSIDDARDALLALGGMLEQEGHAFGSSIAQVARHANSLAELEQVVTRLYQIALERSLPIVADIADAILQWIEASADPRSASDDVVATDA
jgi:ABC-type transporter Mla subunit MlaD